MERMMYTQRITDLIVSANCFPADEVLVDSGYIYIRTIQFVNVIINKVPEVFGSICGIRNLCPLVEIGL